MLIEDAQLGGGGGSVDMLEGEAVNRIKRDLTGSTEQHNVEQNLSSKWTLNGLPQGKCLAIHEIGRAHV